MFVYMYIHIYTGHVYIHDLAKFMCIYMDVYIGGFTCVYTSFSRQFLGISFQMDSDHLQCDLKRTGLQVSVQKYRLAAPAAG